MPVRAWEAQRAGSPAAKRGRKKRYGVSRDNPPFLLSQNELTAT